MLCTRLATPRQIKAGERRVRGVKKEVATRMTACCPTQFAHLIRNGEDGSREGVLELFAAFFEGETE
jgi:hypothetical protein